MNSLKSIAPARGGRLAIFVTSSAVCLIGLSAAAYGQTGQAAATNPQYRPEDRPPVNSETLSCKQLKDDVQRAGGLSIVSAPKRWPETFYGPEVPQCDPWTRPMFTYVNTNDGACGVGYICAQRVTGGR